jgi:hypothetical protein
MTWHRNLQVLANRQIDSLPKLADLIQGTNTETAAIVDYCTVVRVEEQSPIQNPWAGVSRGRCAAR